MRIATSRRLALLTGFLALTIAPAARADDPLPGATIAHDTTLAADIAVGAAFTGTVLRIVASGVTIDGAGHTITLASGAATGIRSIADLHGVTVKNLTIVGPGPAPVVAGVPVSDPHTGIALDGDFNAVTGCTVSGLDTGIALTGDHDVASAFTVSDCTVGIALRGDHMTVGGGGSTITLTSGLAAGIKSISGRTDLAHDGDRSDGDHDGDRGDHCDGDDHHDSDDRCDRDDRDDEDAGVSHAAISDLTISGVGQAGFVKVMLGTVNYGTYRQVVAPLGSSITRLFFDNPTAGTGIGLAGSDNRVAGVSASGLDTAIDLSGSGNSVTGCTIGGCNAGVDLHGSDGTVASSVFTGIESRPRVTPSTGPSGQTVLDIIFPGSGGALDLQGYTGSVDFHDNTVAGCSVGIGLDGVRDVTLDGLVSARSNPAFGVCTIAIACWNSTDVAVLHSDFAGTRLDNGILAGMGVFVSDCGDVVIDRITATGCSMAVSVLKSRNVAIGDSHIVGAPLTANGRNLGSGVSFETCINSAIEHVTIEGCSDAIGGQNDTDISVVNCYIVVPPGSGFRPGPAGTGVVFGLSVGCTVDYTTVTGCISAIDLGGSGHSVTNCTIQGCALGVSLGGDTCSALCNVVSARQAFEVQGYTGALAFEGNDVTGSFTGISLDGVNGVKLSGLGTARNPGFGGCDVPVQGTACVDVAITRSDLHGSGSYGVFLGNSSNVLMDGDDVSGRTSGILISGDAIRVTGCKANDCAGTGISVTIDGTPTLATPGITVTNCQASRCDTGIFASGLDGEAMNVTLDTARGCGTSAFVVNNILGPLTFSGNDVTGSNIGLGMDIIAAGTTFDGLDKKNKGLGTCPGVAVLVSDSSGVTFSNTDLDGGGVGGTGLGVSFSDNITFDHVTVEGWTSSGMNFYYVTSSVVRCCIFRNDAIGLDMFGDGDTIMGSSFCGNATFALVNEPNDGTTSDPSGISVWAEGNYWGDPTGPSAPDNPVSNGRGDAISGIIDYASWATAGKGCAPVLRPDTKAPVSAIGVNGSAYTVTQGGISVQYIAGKAHIVLSATDPAVDGAVTSGVAATYYATGATCGYVPYAAPIALPEGVQSVQFYSVDNAGNCESIRCATFSVDCTPPDAWLDFGCAWPCVCCHTLPILQAGAQVAIGAEDPLSGARRAQPTASGVAGITLRLDGGAETPYTGPLTLGPGLHTIVMAAVDHVGNRGEQTARVWINRPPSCAGARASQTTLSAGNALSAPISILGVTDPDGDPVTITITDVFQDEPRDRGSNGKAVDDAVICATSARLLATRQDQGDGRFYHIRFVAEDDSGGVAQGEVTVCVPRDTGSKAPAPRDGGALFSSTDNRNAWHPRGPDLLDGCGRLDCDHLRRHGGQQRGSR